MAVLPSADSATEAPWREVPAAPVPTSFGPCCTNCASASCDDKSRAAKIRTVALIEIGQIRAVTGGSPSTTGKFKIRVERGERVATQQLARVVLDLPGHGEASLAWRATPDQPDRTRTGDRRLVVSRFPEFQGQSSINSGRIATAYRIACRSLDEPSDPASASGGWRVQSTALKTSSPRLSALGSPYHQEWRNGRGRGSPAAPSRTK
jgi:hypothetical protein